jgi:hypothetical protein
MGGVAVLLFLTYFSYFEKELKETQNYWAFGLLPSSRKHDVSGTGNVCVLR